MTADNITVERLESLLASLDVARESINRLIGKVLNGNKNPVAAAAIVNETIANLINEAR